MSFQIINFFTERDGKNAGSIIKDRDRLFDVFLDNIILCKY